jgi:hypothetical protein
MKLTKRKGFNFFRSYFDVYNMLGDSDKIQFIDALLNRQFMGTKPETLKGMAEFAYVSQTNSIDSQVKGYEDKTKTRLNGVNYIPDSCTPTVPPTVPPTDGGKQTPTVQEEVKEEEKGKEKPIILKEKFISYSESEFLDRWKSAREFYLKKPFHVTKLDFYDIKKFKEITSKYDKKQIDNAIGGLMTQKGAIPQIQLKPSHFLEIGNFQMYLTCWDSKENLFQRKEDKKAPSRI